MAGTHDNLLFVGFLLTILWTLVDKIFGNPTLNLYWIPDRYNVNGFVQVSLGYAFWITAINLYIGFLWHDKAMYYRNEMYRFIACCYYFAVVEMFCVWDNPWFMLFGFIPMTSNTLIAFGFAYYYSIWKWRTV